MKINMKYTFSLFQEIFMCSGACSKLPPGKKLSYEWYILHPIHEFKGFFYALFSHKAINYSDALDLSPHPEC